MSSLEDNTHNITIKAGAGHDQPWHVIRFRDMAHLRQQLKDCYGIEADESQPLPVLVGQAQAVWKGLPIAERLGGTVVTETRQPPAQEEKKLTPEEIALAAIERADSRQSMQDVFAKYEALITSTPAILEAAKAKFASLS